MDLLSEMRALLELSGHYAGNVPGASGRKDVRTMCFWNIRNRVKITEEILSFYRRSWKSAMIDVDDEEVGGELVERIVTVTKNLFVDVVSAIEKTARETLDMYRDRTMKDRAMRDRNYLYLRNILQASTEYGMVSSDTFREWDDILVLRNLVAHNNSVSDRSKRLMVSGVTISMRPGRMMKGPLNTFVVLSERIMTLFYEWLVSMDRSMRPGPRT